MKSGVPHARVTALIVFCLATSACAAPAARGLRSAAPTAESRIYDVGAKRYISMTQLIDAVSDADVVFFGEQHDDPATHRAELAFLARLGAVRPGVVVSLEMFERDVQPLLDRYLTGGVTDSVFLANARPWPNYVKDYRPLVELARANGWPVVAANVPRRLASVVSHAGIAALDTLAAADRALVAADRSCPHDMYYDRFADAMSGHSAGGADADTAGAHAVIDRFYEAQCVKDETMAESIVRALDRAGRGAVVVHYNGAFHSNSGLGTVARVARRRPQARTIVITAVPVDAAARPAVGEYTGLGDYIVLAPQPALAPH
jgi:uncharacterized iron-regulated protein